MTIATRTFAAASFALAASNLHAQSIFDTGIRVAPQFVQYTLNAPASIKISEFSSPFFVTVPLLPRLTVDVGSAYSQSHVDETTNGTAKTSTISGLTDTQVRANYSIGTDFLVLTAGANLPTGQATVNAQQQVASGLIGSDFLGFPISNMGAGFGATAGVAVARPVGAWNVGFGGSMRRSGRYDPFQITDTTQVHYQPGNEYRARLGIDHPLGTGRIAAGLTYSRFSNDDLGGAKYNTGDRFLTQGMISNGLGAGDVVVAVWNLFRTAGTLADGSYLGREDIANVVLGYGVPVGGARLEPSAEVRTWLQSAAATSVLANLGVRLSFAVGGMGVSPSVGYSIGKIAAQGTTGNATSASMNGFRAMLAASVR